MKNDFNELIPKFNSNTFLKKTICDSMYIDANQFLWRVHHLILINEFHDRNWYSKIYVDLIMAVESDLKAIIVALSKSSETPEEAYKAARSKGHNINNLYVEAEGRSKNRLKLLSKKQKLLLINRFATLSVNNRYELITFYDIRNDTNNNNFTDEAVKYVLTLDSILELEKISNKLHKISKIAVAKKPLIALTGKNIMKYFRRLDKFKANVGRL